MQRGHRLQGLRGRAGMRQWLFLPGRKLHPMCRGQQRVCC